MAIEPNPAEQWDRVAAELRAYKEAQQRAWGDIDNATLGRYLAGDLSGDERQHVEQALTQLPELRKLTDIVRDVLDETDVAGAETPATISFPQRRPAKPWFSRTLRSRGALVAAALLLGLGLTFVSMRLIAAMGQAKPSGDLVALRDVTAEKPNGLAVSTPQALPGSTDRMDKRPPLMMAKASKDKTIVEGWKQVGTSATTMLAATQEQLGDFYQQNGDYDRAESLLATARDLRREALGEQAPQTVQTSHKLAQVCDQATQRQIQLISRRHHVEFRAVTVASLTDHDAKDAVERAKKEPNVISLMICKEPPSVQVVIAEPLRQKGFTAESEAELRQLVETSVKKREPNRGILLAVRYVAQRCDQVTQRRKIAVGAGAGNAATTALPLR